MPILLRRVNMINLHAVRYSMGMFGIKLIRTYIYNQVECISNICDYQWNFYHNRHYRLCVAFESLVK